MPMSREPLHPTEGITVLTGDALERLRELPDASVDCIATSPPFF